MIRVLYVDQAEAFGGSLVVAGLLIEELDRKTFSPAIATAFNDEFTRRRFATAKAICRARSPLPYTRMEHLRARAGRIRWSWLRAFTHLSLSALDLVASAKYCAQLVALILGRRISVVHANNSVEAIVAALITRRPVLYHLHGAFGSPLDARHRFIFSRCAAVVAISEYVRNSATEAGLDGSRIEIVPNGTELPALNVGGATAVRQRWGIPSQAPVIALVGRVVEWKGHREFVHAAIEVHKRFPDAHFMFVGGVSDGTPEFLEELYALGRRNGLTGRLHCTGYVSDVPAHIEAATVVVHASIEPEPFGLVIIEGMAMARPVVASTLGAGPEIISDGVDGLLVDPRDTRTLAGAICRLLEDPAFATRIGTEARRTVETKYRASVMARSFEAIYRRITGAQQKSR